MLITLAVVACIAALVAWRTAQRGDPRLVGRWLVTSDAPATDDQRRAAIDASPDVERTVWTLRGNGSGWIDRQERVTFMTFVRRDFRWHDEGNWLVLQPRPNYASRWEWAIESLMELAVRIRTGRHRRRPGLAMDYTLQHESPSQIRAEHWNANAKSRHVFYLTRIPEQ